MGEGNPRPLGDLIRETASLLRASDTFKLMTSEGAARLSARACERTALIKSVRTQLIPRIPELREQREFDEILRLAESEAAAQEKLAAWLRRLAGDGAEA